MLSACAWAIKKARRKVDEARQDGPDGLKTLKNVRRPVMHSADAAFLQKTEMRCRCRELAAGNSGKDGVSRGRGDAPMTWTDGQWNRGEALRNSYGTLGTCGPQDSQLVGRSVGANVVEKSAAANPGPFRAPGREQGGTFPKRSATAQATPSTLL